MQYSILQTVNMRKILVRVAAVSSTAIFYFLLYYRPLLSRSATIMYSSWACAAGLLVITFFLAYRRLLNREIAYLIGYCAFGVSSLGYSIYGMMSGIAFISMGQYSAAIYCIMFFSLPVWISVLYIVALCRVLRDDE